MVPFARPERSRFHCLRSASLRSCNSTRFAREGLPYAAVNFSEMISFKVRARLEAGLRSESLSVDDSVGRTRFKVGK